MRILHLPILPVLQLVANAKYTQYYFKKREKMLDQCEMLGKCGFFTNFKGNSEVIKQGWVKTYCENHIKSSKCERKKIRAQTGKPPADHMAPTGKLL